MHAKLRTSHGRSLTPILGRCFHPFQIRRVGFDKGIVSQQRQAIWQHGCHLAIVFIHVPFRADLSGMSQPQAIGPTRRSSCSCSVVPIIPDTRSSSRTDASSGEPENRSTSGCRSARSESLVSRPSSLCGNALRNSKLSWACTSESTSGNRSAEQLHQQLVHISRRSLRRSSASRGQVVAVERLVVRPIRTLRQAERRADSLSRPALSPCKVTPNRYSLPFWPTSANLSLRLKSCANLPIGSAAMANTAETVHPRIELPIAPDRRRQDRVRTHLPIRILSIDGNPVFYPGVCTNLGRGGVGFETSARIEVGKVIEFEFVQVVDEAVRYWLRILFRSDGHYGGYYVNDDGSQTFAPPTEKRIATPIRHQSLDHTYESSYCCQPPPRA